jgi:hypothetical protein
MKQVARAERDRIQFRSVRSSTARTVTCVLTTSVQCTRMLTPAITSYSKYLIPNGLPVFSPKFAF